MTQLSRYNFADEIELSDVAAVVFTAPWCSFCESMEKVCEGVEKLCPQVRFFKVDIDENPEISEKYEVRSVPSTIFFKGKDMKGRKTGLMSKKELYDSVLAVSEEKTSTI